MFLFVNYFVFFSPLVPASHPSEHLRPSHQNHQPSEQQSSAHIHKKIRLIINLQKAVIKNLKQIGDETYSSKSRGTIRSWWSRGSWVTRCTRFAISSSGANISLRGRKETIENII